MGYRYLEDVAIADVAFLASGDTAEALFRSAANATLNTMVEDLATVRPLCERPVRVSDDALDLLLFNYLQEILFYKDAEQLLLCPAELAVSPSGALWSVRGTWAGEPLDPCRHAQVVDVKAVTLHRFEVTRTDAGWTAFVILDI